ncbi:hypothetical protein [Pedobacter sp. P26]|uniref:hypothetical protein n=1 Tax=Pedobacter sp. P26 TaxID=3423956 RepID=UPI003D669226
MESFLICSSPEHFVMLRNEASAIDATDASFLSMTVPIKKIGIYSRTIGTEEPLPLLFKNKKMVSLCLRGKKAGHKKAPR